MQSTIKSKPTPATKAAKAPLGTLKPWHSPHNAACPAERDPHADCTCKRVVQRKPYRVIRIHERQPPHGVSAHLVLHVWPDGRMEIRERGRRSGYSAQVSIVLYRAMWAQAMKLANEKAKARKAKRAAKRQRRR